MSNDMWKSAITQMIDDTFAGNGGLYLDQGTNMVAELRELTGAQASAELPGAGNSVANQVKHLLTAAKTHASQFAGKGFPQIDWEADWQGQNLSNEEWAALVEEFAATQQELKDGLNNPDMEENEEYAGAAVMLAAHHAYHAGQIRHAAAYAKQP